MKALLGQKIGMTQLFDKEGNVMPVTVIEAGSCVVTQVKTKATDGYNAVQLGFGEAKRLSKPLAGHLAKSKANPRQLHEVRLNDIQPGKETEVEPELNLKVGQKLDASTFAVGDSVKVIGISKGKGFAGTIKRHNFSRGPKTHGSHNYRQPGSIGSMFPQHVFKGIKMAGRLGGQRVTVKGLKVVMVDGDNNLIAINGAVPGPRRSLVVLEAAENG